MQNNNIQISRKFSNDESGAGHKDDKIALRFNWKNLDDIGARMETNPIHFSRRLGDQSRVSHWATKLLKLRWHKIRAVQKLSCRLWSTKQAF